MNLEPRIESKALWWGGSYGGVTKDGQFLMLYRKPVLPIPDYDEVLSKPLMGVGENNVFVKSGRITQLTANQVDAMSNIIDSAFPTQGGGGGDVPTAISAITVDKNAVGLRLGKTDGTSQVLPFESIRANALNFYLNIKVADTNKAIKRDLRPRVEYDVPFDQIDMAGSRSYVWFDRARNVVILPVGGTKGDVKCSVGFSFQPTIQEDIAIRSRIYMRELGSSAAWTQIYEITNRRTASQSTGAMYIEGNLRSYQFPNYPVELRYTFELLEEPVAADWANRLMFHSSDDYLSVSTTKSAYENYNT